MLRNVTHSLAVVKHHAVFGSLEIECLCLKQVVSLRGHSCEGRSDGGLRVADLSFELRRRFAIFEGGLASTGALVHQACVDVVLVTVELNEVMEDFGRREVIIREWPVHAVHNFLAFVQKRLAHFHELGPLDDGLSVVDSARIVSQLERVHLPSVELGRRIDAKLTILFASLLGRKPVQARLLLKDRVISSEASVRINSLISGEEVATMLIFRGFGS